MLSLLITHLNQGIFVKMIFYPSEKIGTEKFSTMLEQFELEKPHHAWYETTSSLSKYMSKFHSHDCNTKMLYM